MSSVSTVQDMLLLMSQPRILALVSFAASTVLACGTLLELGDLSYEVEPSGGAGGSGASGSGTGGDATGPGGTGGSGGPVGAGGANGGSGGAPPACPQGTGPTMVDVGMFCIDSTEVTNDQYADFLAASVPPQSMSGDPAYCVFNASYLPSNWPRPPAEGARPVGAMDWCDAYAYCEWAGKRLCGAVGGTAGNFTDFTNPSLSEWHYACTQGGMTTYSYGSTPDPQLCNVTETGNGSAVDVGSMSTCTGTAAPFDAVFDLSGNSHEWTAECEGYNDQTEECRVRGGAYTHSITSSVCGDSASEPRGSSCGDCSFRCCADN